ncbi:molybdopterin/thiamine biosynthesis adenylyltransferase [Saccharothrix tamanrassetensis]|uniref:Molybdopterin/thiamine biosynthesis adenylyltransferase n=1 Tax=Saccharothrix tamanrassetensis TaxID=1051531 RepID=A0A841CIJ5_9PSEU|nr:ThiF family adenylyltransferase [Saccharothrix tamanrassetensis]MBB5955825.1 molybdopterin/thiamine biosynthesis adenylyltransferase [Saccharothrix tamanrassetensis]
MSDGIQSRSILAGYDPAVLGEGSVLIVGAGALGQNIAQSLALSGVGTLHLVDFDVFEAHNATRSPFFPTADEFERHSGLKAPQVAERCAAIATASRPDMRASATMIQRLGDRPIAAADVVISAVDSVTARAWLSERSRLHGKPMVEGGFAGSLFNFSTFSAASGRVCYRCHNPFRESAASCTRYALAAEAENIVPAIQTAAAVLGGYMAEQCIGLLHGKLPSDDVRYYGDIRRATVSKARLQVNPHCPGHHDNLPVLTQVDVRDWAGSAADLATAVANRVGRGVIRLAEPFHITYSCTGCSRFCAVMATESAWLVDSRCVDCGGPWQLSDAKMPSSVAELRVPDDLVGESPLAVAPMAVLGATEGASFVFEGTAGLGLIVLTDQPVEATAPGEDGRQCSGPPQVIPDRRP